MFSLQSAFFCRRSGSSACSLQHFIMNRMASSRVLSLKNPKTLEQLAKQFIIDPPSKSQALWMGDADEVCANYEKFLIAVAKEGYRLEQKIFTKVLKDVLECDVITLGKFAKQLKEALSHARSKSKGMTTGEKLEDAVLKIVLAYNSSECKLDPASSQSDLEQASQIPVVVAADEDATTNAQSLFDAARKMFAAPQLPSRPLQRVLSIASSSAASPVKQPEKDKRKNEEKKEVLTSQVF